jgi:hypothetical protein
VVVPEQPSESLPAPHLARREPEDPRLPVVGLRQRDVADALVRPLKVVMVIHELAEKVPQVDLPADDEAV